MNIGTVDAMTRAAPSIVLVLIVCGLGACGDGDDDSVADRSPTSSMPTPERDALPVEGEPGSDGSANADDADDSAGTDDTAGDGLYPDVVDATATYHPESGTFSFDVTLSSPYDSPERYADAWRIVGPDGEQYGERILTHDHAAEQPFTRSLSDVTIPDGVDVVTVEGRDQRNGYGGATITVELVRS